MTAMRAMTTRRADLKNCTVGWWLVVKRKGDLLEVGTTDYLSFYIFPANVMKVT